MLKVLPSTDTRVVKLSDAAELNPRLGEKPTLDAKVSFVPMAAVSSETGAVVSEEIRPYGEVAKGYTAFENGDVLVAKITPCFENNKIAQANLSLPIGFGSTEFHVVRARQGEADPRYLHHFLRQDHVRSDGERKMTGSAGQRRVPEHFLADLDILLPPLPEQKRIAAILDQADALRAKRREALAKLDEMAQAIFVEMFVSNASKSEAWPRRGVGSVALAMRTGPFGSQLLHSEFVDEGVAVLGIDNAVSNQFAWGERRFITERKYRELSRYRVFPNDVIVTIMGTCGRVAIVPEDIPLAITTKHLCSITLDKEQCLPEFLHACLLRHPEVLRQLGAAAKGAVMPGLNMGIIKSALIPLPPVPLQAEFVNRTKSLTGMVAQNNDALDMSDELFSSLQHRAFRGEL